MKAGPFLKRHWGGLLVILLLVGAGAYLLRQHGSGLDREAILAYGMSLSPALVIAAFFLLPLVGFPVSVLLVLLGLRFGIGWGMFIVAVGMLFHHLVVYGVARSWLRERMKRRLAAFGHRIPPIQERHRLWFTALFASIHGPPYTAKLYLLALTDLPFRYYCGIGLPIYIGFSLLPVGAGTAVMDLDAMTLSAIVLATVALLFFARWLKQRYAPSEPSREPENERTGDGI